ncbi:MAG: septum formation protein Maf [Bacteroidales bacterium]|nr:septum formation protein Maf [Bacteroidales bacterium]
MVSSDGCMVLEQLKSYNVVLASKSPRRQELLKGMGLDFSVLTKDLDEFFPDHLPPTEVASYLSRVKAEAFREEELPENYLLIAADTVVIVGSAILNKPGDIAETIGMLGQLSGKTHTVATGICLRTAQKTCVFTDFTEVDFAKLSHDEMEYYAQNYRPFDKAGAYGIQEWIGFIGITGIRGSFYNVMGLPTQRLYNELKQFISEPKQTASETSRIDL